MKTDDMTDEEKRIRIAETCGWIAIDGEVNVGARPTKGLFVVCDTCNYMFRVGQFEADSDECDHDKKTAYKQWRKDELFVSEYHLPDYLSDLNAMHEAEKTLRDDGAFDQWSTYCIHLNRLACRIECKNTHTCGFTIAATARQRADAFLLTQP